VDVKGRRPDAPENCSLGHLDCARDVRRRSARREQILVLQSGFR
jgi:hypothetical protein